MGLPYASFEVDEEQGDLVFKVEDLNGEDFCTILGAFRDAERDYSNHFHTKFLTGESDQVAGRKDEGDIREYLDHLRATIYRLERLYDLTGPAYDRLYADREEVEV